MHHPLVALALTLLPVRDAAGREVLALAEPPPDDGAPAIALRAATYDDEGGVRSLCEQVVTLVPPHHAAHPGLAAWLRASLAAIPEIVAEDPDDAPLPADLFLRELLDMPGVVDEAEFRRLLADPVRRAAILADRELAERHESYESAVGAARVGDLLALRRPRWLLTTDPLDDEFVATVAPHESQLGGLPGLPPDAAWPTLGGEPLMFVGQIDLESLPPGEGRELLPPRGVLSLFIGGGEDPEARGPGRLLWSPDPSILVRRAAPEGRDDLVLPASTVTAATDVPTLPGWEQPFYVLLLDTFTDPSGDPYARAAEQLRDLLLQEGAWWPEGAPRHQLLGWPYVLQGDPLAAAAHDERAQTMTPHPEWLSREHAEQAATWRLLLQIDSDDDFLLGDGGVVYVLMRDADLAARRFDRARIVWQMH